VFDALSYCRGIYGVPDVRDFRQSRCDYGRAPVVDSSGRLVGLVSRKDVLRVRAEVRALERERATFFRLNRAKDMQSSV